MSSFGDRILLAMAPRMAAGMMSLLHALMKIDVIDEVNIRQCWEKNEHVIISFWHDQLFMMVKGYHGPGARILISASKDGELISRTMRYFGQDSVRGSSNRGGRAAFKHMLDISRQPFDLVITPDGPKGPRHQVKDGLVQLARLSGRPVVPMAFACSRGHRFQSWDRFLFPYPWGKGVYRFGEPLSLRKGESVDAFRVRIQQAMHDNTRKAQEHLTSHGLSSV